ncbi:MAG: tetrahydrofolate dehydrogenase/cyclohydrolase catalytic domain-containing protein [Rickettsiales bacterium]
MIENSSKIINGSKIALDVCNIVKQQVAALKENNIYPGLAVIIVGEDPASLIYVKRKKEMAEKLGIYSNVIYLDKNISQQNLISKINHLNNDPKINGILLQLPLPKHIDKRIALETISPLKDVDGLTPTNVGKLALKDETALAPCTPQGCLILVKSVQKHIAGLNAVVIGRSNIVGSPLAAILLNNDCTVTIIHSKTKNPQEISSKADLLFVAAGKQNLVNKDWIKKNAIVVDVGINRININEKTKIVGDVDFEDVIDIVRAITPVPKGVGPMTIACLMKNTIKATCIQENISLKDI